MRYIALAIVLISAAMAQATAQTPAPSPAPASTPVPAPAQTTNPNAWQTYITPYVWIPSLNAQLTFQHPTLPISLTPGNAAINVHVGPSSYLTHLNFVAMLAAYAQHGDMSFGADYIYLNLSATNASVTSVTGPDGRVEVPINVSTGAHVRGSLLTLEVGTHLNQSETSPVEIVAGTRYLGTTMSADWNFSGPLDILSRSGSATRNNFVWDAIFGFRGKVGLGSHWYLPYYIDYGAGANNTTNQEYVGIAYSERWGDIVLVNRWLEFDFSNSNSIQLVGPTLGARIRL